MAEPKPRVSPLTIAGDGLLLFCALGGFACSFLTLYTNHDLGATPLDPCAAQWPSFFLLPALFALLSLAAWSLPWYRWVAAGGLALLIGAAAALNWETVVHGAGITIHIITAIFSLRVSWGWRFVYDPDLPLSAMPSAIQLFLVLALALLALVLGWAVVRAKRWWVVVLFTLPPLLPGLLADLYPDWPAFLALCACWCTMLLTDLCKWAAPSGRGRLTLATLGCVFVVLATATLAFPREGYTRPRWALRMEAELYNVTSRFSDFFSQWDGPFPGVTTYVGAADEADLTDAGPLNYTGRTVLRVDTDYEGRLYLRGASLAVYQDGVWTGLPDGIYQDYLDGLEEEPPFPLTLPTLLGSPGTEHTAVIENLGAAGSCAYAPYFLTQQDWQEAGMLPVEDAYLARLRGQSKFTVTFAEVEPPQETGPTVRYQNLVYANYLDVPEELEEALAPLVSQVYAPWVSIGSGHWRPDHPSVRVSIAQNVAQLLAERCQYDPQAPAAPEGTDPVDYFLNNSRRGYCMHYASAAALTLRALGIPARYVSGFTADCLPGQQADVPDRAAHAWVEIWLDGFGWYPVEVTPAAAFEWYEHGDAEPSPTPSNSAQESESPAPTPTPESGASAPPSAEPSAAADGPAGGSGLTALLAVLKVLAAIAGVLALLWLGQWLPKKLRAKRLSSPDRNRAALDAYGCLRRLERWGGRVDERAVELAQKARFSQHTLSQEELAELRGLVDRERARLCAGLSPVKWLAFRYLWGKPAQAGNRENPEKSEENTP